MNSTYFNDYTAWNLAPDHRNCRDLYEMTNSYRVKLSQCCITELLSSQTLAVREKQKQRERETKRRLFIGNFLISLQQTGATNITILIEHAVSKLDFDEGAIK